jgi:hypothetical protein
MRALLGRMKSRPTSAAAIPAWHDAKEMPLLWNAALAG